MTKSEFLAIYREEEEIGEDWKVLPLSENLCLDLLSELPPETLLLSKKVPLGVLRLLSTHRDSRIRCMVADKRAAAPLLDALSQDTDAAVRLRVCYNAKVGIPTLRRLLVDEEPEVRRVASERLSMR